jgi:hypothetical protein
LSHRYCYLPLSWTSWNWFECAVCGVRSSISSTITAGSSVGLTIPEAVCTVLCSDDERRNRLKHVDQFIEMNRSRKCCILLVVL